MFTRLMSFRVLYITIAISCLQTALAAPPPVPPAFQVLRLETDEKNKINPLVPGGKRQYEDALSQEYMQGMGPVFKEYLRQVDAAIRYYVDNPNDPWRWDAIAIACMRAIGYLQTKQERMPDGTRPSKEDMLQAHPLIGDEFYGSSKYRNVLALAEMALASNDCHRTAKTHIAWTMMTLHAIYEIRSHRNLRWADAPPSLRQAVMQEQRHLLTLVESLYTNGGAQTVERDGYYSGYDMYRFMVNIREQFTSNESVELQLADQYALAALPFPEETPIAKFRLGKLDAPKRTNRSESDGPYVLLTNSEAGEALYVQPFGSSEKKFKTVAVRIGDILQIEKADGRPAFHVQLRPPTRGGNDPDEIDARGQRVFLMADTHGEFGICTELLIKQGVIDEALQWNFGSGRLVILGDIFDRGAYQTEIVWLLYKLEEKARRAGGAVHLLLGNHETMVLTNNVSYLNLKYLAVAAAVKRPSYAELWGRETLLGNWIRTKPTILKLGNVLCLHGGVSTAAVNEGLTFQQMNQVVRNWLNDDKSKDSGQLSFVTGRNGPLWYRGLVQKDAKPEDVEAIKKFYGVERLAVGHTIVPTVTSLYNGSVIAVQVYPTKDKATGKMNMEGVYIDEQGTWHKAKIDGTREVLRDDAGNPIKNGVLTPAARAPAEGQPISKEKPLEQKKAA